MGTDNIQTFGANDSDIDRATIEVPVPAQDPDLYRYQVTDELLRFLIDRPLKEYTQRQLASLLDRSHRSIGMAVGVMEPNGLLTVTPEGNKKLVSINRERVSRPSQPVLRIPQPEFHEPIQTAVRELRERLDGVLGIEVYGSVARGEADRQSDIDLWVLVREHRGRNLTRAQEVGTELADRTFDGDRYDYHIVVETPESVPEYTAEIAEIVRSGITLFQTEEFERFRSRMEGMVDGQ